MTHANEVNPYRSDGPGDTATPGAQSDNATVEQDSVGETKVANPNSDRHPIVYLAVVPAILLLFAVAIYIYTARPVREELFSDFELRLPLITQLAMFLSKYAIVLFLPPAILTGLLIWYAQRKPITHTLCVAIACIASSLMVAQLFQLAFTAPLTSLMQGLSS